MMGDEAPGATSCLLPGLRRELPSSDDVSVAPPPGACQAQSMNEPPIPIKPGEALSADTIGRQERLPPVESLLPNRTFEWLLSHRVEQLDLIRCQDCGSRVAPGLRLPLSSQSHLLSTHDVLRSSAPKFRSLSAPSSLTRTQPSEAPNGVPYVGHIAEAWDTSVSPSRLTSLRPNYAMRLAQVQRMERSTGERKLRPALPTNAHELENSAMNDVRRIRRPKTRKVWTDFERDVIKEYCELLLSTPAYAGELVLPSDTQTWENIKNALWCKYPGRFQRSRQGIMELARKMKLRRGTREELQKRQEGPLT